MKCLYAVYLMFPDGIQRRGKDIGETSMEEGGELVPKVWVGVMSADRWLSQGGKSKESKLKISLICLEDREVNSPISAKV